jgi:hypothetical protein
VAPAASTNPVFLFIEAIFTNLSRSTFEAEIVSEAEFKAVYADELTSRKAKSIFGGPNKKKDR